jgi:hypothetical protein
MKERLSEDLKVLEPYHRLEAIRIDVASKLFDIPERTLRRWCLKYKIGRRVGGYKRPWTLSKVALLMVINRDWDALGAYHRGVRKEDPVARYYLAAGLESLLRAVVFGICAAR